MSKNIGITQNFINQAQALAAQSQKSAVHHQPPTAQEIANYNRFSGHPMSNHMQADGTVVSQPLGGSK